MLSRPSNLGGPVPKFNDYHIWKAFQCLDDTNPVGRKKLSQILGIGEGSTRTILSMMQDQSMITIGKSGILLTDAGTEFKKSVHMDVADISISDLTIGDRDCAVRVPKMARNVKYGCEERDAAIKSGATGATTLIYTNGKLIFPGSDYPVDPRWSRRSDPCSASRTTTWSSSAQARPGSRRRSAPSSQASRSWGASSSTGS